MRSIVTASLLLFPLTWSHAQRALILQDNRQEYLLGTYLDVLEDKTGQWKINDVTSEPLASQFTRVRVPVPNYGLSPSVYWARFAVVDSSSTTDQWLFEVNYPLLDDLMLFVPSDNGFTVKRAGSLHPFAQREIKARTILFHLPLRRDSSTTFYVRLSTETSKVMPFAVLRYDRYMAEDHSAQLLFGAFYGILLVMMAYNLFLFISVRDSSFIFYVLYVLGVGAWQFGIDGFAQEYLVPQSASLDKNLFLVGSWYGFVMELLFVRSYLLTKKHSPRFDRGLLAVSLVGAACGLLIPLHFFSFATNNRAVIEASMIFTPLTIVAAFFALRQRFAPARFFMIAVVGYILGQSVVVLRLEGFLQTNFFTMNALRLGILWEAVMFSFALGNRVNTIRAEKEVEQEEMRQRIASDLHDEIGSNLGSIVVSSQLMRRENDLNPGVKERLGNIAQLATRTAMEMRDIVWFINPQHDQFGDLVLKMKEVAHQLLGRVQYEFEAPRHGSAPCLSMEQKRNLFLMYKEILYNVVKHANCANVRIELNVEASRLTMAISDDGCGFDPATTVNGEGIDNITRRSREIGATCDLVTRPGSGTRYVISLRT